MFPILQHANEKAIERLLTEHKKLPSTKFKQFTSVQVEFSGREDVRVCAKCDQIRTAGGDTFFDVRKIAINCKSSSVSG